MTNERKSRKGDLDADVPEADALEQNRAADEESDEEDEPLDEVRIAPDVPEADALEQAREAGLDDDGRA